MGKVTEIVNATGSWGQNIGTTACRSSQRLTPTTILNKQKISLNLAAFLPQFAIQIEMNIDIVAFGVRRPITPYRLMYHRFRISFIEEEYEQNKNKIDLPRLVVCGDLPHSLSAFHFHRSSTNSINPPLLPSPGLSAASVRNK